MRDSFWKNHPELFTDELDFILPDYRRFSNYADNVTLNAGSGGAVLATDDIGPGIHHQLVKVEFGAADSATMVSPSAGLPVNLVADYATIVDDAAFTPGTSRVTMVGAEFDDVTPDSVNEGDAGALRMSANRNLYVNIRDNAGNERGLNVDAAGAIAVTDGGGSFTVDNAALSVVGGGAEATALRVTLANDSTGLVSIDDNGSSITVDGTVAVTNGGTFVVQENGAALTALQLIDDAIYAVNGAISKSMLMGGQLDDAAITAATENNVAPVRITAQRAMHMNLRDSAGAEITTLPVSLASVPSHAVTNAGTFAVQAVSAGDTAHDAADGSTNPVKIGAVARTTNPTAVADGDRVNAYADDLGRLVNYPFAPRDRIVKGSRISLTSTAETTLIAAGAAGIFRDLLWVLCSNESSTEVRVDFRDIAAGTVLFSIDLAADGGGAVVALPVCWPQATAASAWTATCNVGASTVYVSALAIEQN